MEHERTQEPPNGSYTEPNKLSSWMKAVANIPDIQNESQFFWWRLDSPSVYLSLKITRINKR